MPLTDFVRYLNAQLPLPMSALRSTTPFVSEGGSVFVSYANLRLESRFSSIIDTHDGSLRGHAAFLVATRRTDGQSLGPDAVFKLPGDDQELIFLDRLVRTLHTLNYLTYKERSFRELLLLKVHPRHVASVTADHGLAFEEILRACGLLPEQITLELEIGDVEDMSHLLRAITSYKSRGYGIALNHFGWEGSADIAILEAIGPSIVRLDSRLLTRGESVRPLIDHLHSQRVKVVIEGPNTSTLRSDASENGFDLLQVVNPVPTLQQIQPPESADTVAWSAAA